MKNRFKRILIIVLSITILFPVSSIQANAKASDSSVKLSVEVFDADYYYNNNADLQSAIGNNANALLDHYINHGLAEGRSGSAEFNVMAYKNNNADLEAAYGTDYISYCYHYMNCGKAEGRTATGESCASTTAVQPSVVTAPAVNQNVIGTYTTYYDGTISRATNVTLAASRINGTSLTPGASFSFSNTVLPRTAENGYVIANVFLNKKVAKGMGGGICQVSSTLYAALLNAGIPATERYPHSLPVSYMPAGMDATISGNSKDLKFTNTLNDTVQIIASADNSTGTLTVSLVKVE